jgi:hypothetical protein
MTTRKDDVELILQTCLEKVLSEQETIEAVIAQHAALADVLQPQIENALWIHSRREALDPGSEFIAISRSRLVAAVERDKMAEKVHSSREKSRVTQGIFVLRSWLQHNSMRLAVVFAFLLTIFIGSRTVLSDASTALPGDQLYGVKLTQERIVLFLSVDKKNDARLSVEYTRRRSNEVHQLIEQGRFDRFDYSVTVFEHQVLRTLSSIGQVATEDTETAQLLALSLEDILSQNQEDFTALAGSIPADAQSGLVTVLNVSQNGINAVQGLLSDVYPTPTLTSTAVHPPSRTPLPTAQLTSTSAPSVTPSKTPRPTPTPLPTEKLVPTLTFTLTFTPTPLPTLIPTSTATQTPKPTNIPTPTPTPSETITLTETATSTPLLTETPTPSETPTLTETASETPLPTDTPPPTPGETLTPTDTPTEEG